MTSFCVNSSRVSGDFLEYSRILGKERLHPDTLQEARFFRNLEKEISPTRERVSRLEIYEEIFERRGMAPHQARRVIEALIGSLLTIRPSIVVFAPGIGRVQKATATFSWNGRIYEVEGNEVAGAVLSAFYWFWNKRPLKDENAEKPKLTRQTCTGRPTPLCPYCGCKNEKTLGFLDKRKSKDNLSLNCTCCRRIFKFNMKIEISFDSSPSEGWK